MPPIDHALVHRARVVGAEPVVGQRDEQGDRESAEALGPWFPARLATRRQSVAAAGEDGSTRRRRQVTYSLIYGVEDEEGRPLTPPTSSDAVQVDRYGVVTQWTLSGEPEAFDSGLEVFGGQAELVYVGDAT